MKKVLLCTINYNQANGALDNLSEAEFPEHAISVLMQDAARAHNLADDAGPLKGITAEHLEEKLKQGHLTDDAVNALQKKLQQGAVLIALRTDSESLDAAKEILTNAGAEGIQIV